jgi:hypothetical protein
MTVPTGKRIQTGPIQVPNLIVTFPDGSQVQHVKATGTPANPSKDASKSETPYFLMFKRIKEKRHISADTQVGAVPPMNARHVSQRDGYVLPDTASYVSDDDRVLTDIESDGDDHVLRGEMPRTQVAGNEIVSKPHTFKPTTHFK